MFLQNARSFIGDVNDRTRVLIALENSVGEEIRLEIFRDKIRMLRKTSSAGYLSQILPFHSSYVVNVMKKWFILSTHFAQPMCITMYRINSILIYQSNSAFGKKLFRSEIFVRESTFSGWLNGLARVGHRLTDLHRLETQSIYWLGFSGCEAYSYCMYTDFIHLIILCKNFQWLNFLVMKFFLCIDTQNTGSIFCINSRRFDCGIYAYIF